MRTLVAQILGLYLAMTLASTALAKVRTFNIGATALASNLRGSLASGRTLLLMVCFTELLLAVCIALGITDLIVAGPAATMFVAFGCYRAMIALRTGNASCTGVPPWSSPQSTAGIFRSYWVFIESLSTDVISSLAFTDDEGGE